jgi:6-pyruvoyl-tetrahydropterin synthase
MAFLRINRFGEVNTRHRSPNQCKDVGHGHYRYHVGIKCCETNLDRNEFIIDHAIVHEIVTRVFNSQMSSCEGMIVEVKNKLMRACKKHRIQVVDMYIKLQPIVPGAGENHAFMEYSSSGNFY